MDGSPLVARLLLAVRGPGELRDEREGPATLARLVLDATGAIEGIEAVAGGARGQRVLLAVVPGLDWVRSFLAIVLGGGEAVPVPRGSPAAEIAQLVRDARPRCAIACAAFGAVFPASLPLIEPPPAHGAAATDVANASEALRAAAASIHADDPALLLYTSGTTGRPKGAHLTHANLAAQAAILRDAWGFSASDTLLHALPLHHLHGIVVALLTALTTPASIKLLDRFEAVVVWRNLPSVSVFMAVPTMYQRLFEAFDAASDAEREAWSAAARALRLATSGSAALPVRLGARWKDLTGAIPLERYGMTEIGMALSNPLERAERRPGFVGRPLPTVEVRIVDDGGVDALGVGELWVRGPSVFRGYHDRPDANASAFRDGWFTTGDVAERAADGMIRLLGRKSVDILKTGGEKVSALEVEEVLREHEAIADIAVVGVPDETWGDRIVAVVVARDGQSERCTPELVRAWSKERLAPYKVPKEVVLVDALPRNAMGKIEKPKIVAMLERTR